MVHEINDFTTAKTLCLVHECATTGESVAEKKTTLDIRLYVNVCVFLTYADDDKTWETP